MKSQPVALPAPVPVGERYLLIRRLAVGGVADIFLARQSATAGFEKDIVIKRLRPELRGNSRAVRMFLEEARVGALLNHPNVVHVYDVDVADGAPYIAMEYIQGGELGTLCRRGLVQKQFLPLEHAVELMRQAAAGLGYLHAKRSADGQALQIVHRDVSPGNLLVTEEGFLKIIDFGMAKTWRSDAVADRMLPGKVGYLSPEQLARASVDLRSDIYALGVVLYEITLGRRLFKGPAHEVVQRIREHDIEPPTFVRRNYPAALEAIVMKALAQAPARRYQSAYDLADDLEQFLQDAKLPSGPVRIARYLDELAHAEGKGRRPELEGSSTGRFSRLDLELDAAPFRTFRAAPGREWDDAEQPIADIASALGLDVAELRAMRVPPAEGAEGGKGSGPVAAATAGSSAAPSESPVPAVMQAPKAADQAPPPSSVADDSGPLLRAELISRSPLDSGSAEALPPAPMVPVSEPVAALPAAEAEPEEITARETPMARDPSKAEAPGEVTTGAGAAEAVRPAGSSPRPPAEAGSVRSFGAALIERERPHGPRWLRWALGAAALAGLAALLLSTTC